MKSAVRRISAASSATADLFAAAQPAAARAGVPRSVVPSRTGPLTAEAVPLPRASPPRAQPLWYAVVFPELAEPQAAAMLPRLSLHAQQFTSLVSIEMPNALLLEIKGSLKLFGSPAKLHAGIDAVWQRLSILAHSAVAPSTLGAVWLARAGKRACLEEAGQLAGGLAELPIACTRWDGDWLQTLRAMGVTRMAELLRLPRPGLARRLSPAAVRDLDIALSRQAAPRRAFVRRERFRERCDFEAEVATVAYLQKALEPLTARCARFLRERQAGVEALELQLRHRVLPATQVRIGLAGVTGERKRLAAVLDEKLHRLELKAPVRGMQLASGLLQPLPPASCDAFAGPCGGRDTAPQLLERLRARLGEEAVYGLRSIPEHRPEAAWRRVHDMRLASTVGDFEAGARIDAAGAPCAGPDAAGSSGTARGIGGSAEMPRPVWLLPEPLPLPVRLQAPCPTNLLLEQGPERIESGWWDGKGVARDYYIARQGQGARWWIFQERHTRSWYLHGVFA